MKTKPWAIGLVFICTLITSTAQILYKFGANRLSWNILSLLTNLPLFLGIILYLTAAAILLLALRHGELSVLYPIIATSYIWVNILSSYIFKEIVNISKWTGIFFVIIGVTLIGIGSRKS